MITQNENKRRAEGRQTRAFNDYFDDYFAQIERSSYLHRFKKVTPFVNSTCTP
jgi:hypothetical protein